MLDRDFFCGAFLVLAFDLFRAGLFRRKSNPHPRRVGDDDSVEMIHFVLEAPCEQTRCLDAHFLTMPIQAGQHAAERALYVADPAGYRQATFNGSLLTFEVTQPRIDEHIELVLLAD